jgi:O-antigen/teichoic acid export membrane protein
LKTPLHPALPTHEQIAKAAAWSFVQTWGRQIVSVLVFLVLARLLEPSAFGVIALTGVLIALLQAFVDQGFSDAVVQRERLDREHLDTAFWANVAIAIVFAAVLVLSAGLIADAFREPTVAPVLRWLSPAIVIGALAGVQNGLLRRNLSFKSLALRSLVGISVGGCVGVAMAIAGYGVWSLVGQQLAGAASSAVVLWTSSEWRPRLRFSFRHLKELASFGISILGTRLLNLVNRRSDDLIIGIALGPIALGFYTVAYRVLLIMTDVLTTAVSQVALSTFARFQTELPRVRRTFYGATKMTSLLAFPAYTAMAVLAPLVVPVLFGHHWDASIPVMQVLAFIGIVHSVAFLDGAVLTALGRPSVVAKLTALNAATNVVAFLIAVHWGILGVAFAYVVRAYLVQPLSFLAVRRLIQIEVKAYLYQYRGPAFSTLPMAAVMIALRDSLPPAIGDGFTLATSILAGLLTYFAAVWLVDRELFGRAFEFARLALAPVRWGKA